MPLGVTSEEDTQVDENYPYLPVDADVEEIIKEEISHRIHVDKEIKALTGVKKMIDGSIHEIVNEHLYEHETADTLRNGYLVEGEDGEEVQIQIRNAYRSKKCAIKQKKGQEPKETNKDIIALAEIFELKKNKDGTFPFPAGTFLYKDTIVVDPTKVHPDMFGDFLDDVRALGVKYKQGKLNPVSEHTELVASPTVHLGRLKPNFGTSPSIKNETDRILAKINEEGLGSLTTEEEDTLEKAKKISKAINLKLHQLFQNIAIKLTNEEEK